MAYQGGSGDVNFSVRRFAGYGKLSGKSIDELRAGERVTLSDADFAAIEKKMADIVKADRPFTRCDVSHAEGLARTEGDLYKRDNAERAIAKGSSPTIASTNQSPCRNGLIAVFRSTLFIGLIRGSAIGDSSSC